MDIRMVMIFFTFKIKFTFVVRRMSLTLCVWYYWVLLLESKCVIAVSSQEREAIEQNSSDSYVTYTANK